MLLNNMERYTQKLQIIPDYNQLLFYNQSNQKNQYELKNIIEIYLTIIAQN